MSATPVGKFFPVSITLFKSPLRDIDFDVFIRITDDNYAHVFAKSTGVDFKRLAQYIRNGTTQLHVREEDRAAFEAFQKKSPDALLNDPAIPAAKKISLVLNMAEQNMAEIFAQLKVSPEAAAVTQKVVRGFLKMLAENPRSLSLLLKTAGHGEYLYYHSISVSIVSIFLAKAAGQNNTKMLEICALGGFLHDIGLTMLPKEIVDSPTALTAAQWREMRLHPKFGLKMIEGASNIPDEVRFIIFQHHEAPNGAGYPTGLKNPVIFMPAKIVSLADAFCALITKRPFREAYTIEQALNILKSETGKFDKDFIQILSALFKEKKKAAA